MLEQAKRGEMDDLEGLEQQRHKLVTQYKRCVSPDAVEQLGLAEKIRQLAAVDTELMTLCQAIREQLSSQLQGMSAGKKMTQAYQNHTG